MMSVNDSSNFNKRVNFFSLIKNRNNSSKLIYKPKISLVYKKDAKTIEKTRNNVINETFNNFSNNVNLLNKYISSNTLNLYSIKNIATKKKFLNRFLSSYEIYQKNSFVDKNLAIDNTFNQNITTLSKLNNANTYKEYNKEKYSFKNQNIINNELTKELKKESVFQNKNNNLIYKNRSEEKQNIREKEIEKRVIKNIEEKINVKVFSKKTDEINISTIKTNHIVNQREERALTNRIYESVIKKWDKENRRRGYLYE